MPARHLPLLRGGYAVTARHAAVGLLFPGQGCQWVGMGSDLYHQYPEARQTFAEASDALGESIASICFDGPEAILSSTTYAQPAILTCSVAAWRSIAARMPVQLVGAAGHSLGEYSALVASGALGLADGVRFVRARGLLMEDVGRQNGGGGMLVVLGLDVAEAEAVAELAAHQSGAPVSVANVNCPGQVVLGGALSALEAAEAIARERGAKRTQHLPISVASHTPLMRPAALALAELATGLDLKAPSFPVVGNGSSAPLVAVEAIRSEVAAQLESRLDWPACVTALVALGPTELWEVGPKSVLAGLCRRIAAAPPVRPLVSAEAIAALLVEAEEA